MSRPAVGSPGTSGDVPTGVITGVSLSSPSAAISVRSKEAVDRPTEAMRSLVQRDPVEECFVFATCNRFEWYVVTDEPAGGKEVLRNQIAAFDPAQLEWLGHQEAMAHLLRVAAGLDSMILGEDEIIGQVRDACRRAEDLEALGPLLERTLWKAIHTGQRVRSETAINDGIVSLGQAAVELAAETRDLGTAHVLVVGAGEMGHTTANAVTQYDPSGLTIANRTPERAAAIVEQLDFPADATDLENLRKLITAADVVITATDSQAPVIDEAMVQSVDETTIVDLARPPDLGPAARRCDQLTVYGFDELTAITQATHDDRADAARAAESIVDAELENLKTELKRARADDVIATIYDAAEIIKEREVAQAKAKFDASGELSSAEAEIIEDLADSLVGQLLAAPTKSLRTAAEQDDWETIQTAIRLYNPEFVSGAVEGDEQTTEQGANESVQGRH